MVCDYPMRTGYRADASQNGDAPPVIEPDPAAPERAVTPGRSTADRQAAQMKERAERELNAARAEAKRLRTHTRNRVAEMKTEALRERIELRTAAEKQIARLREQAERDADATRSGATDEVERILAEAEGEAAAIVDAADLAATETLARTETALAGMVEDAHRLAAQIVDAAQLEADGIVAEAGKRIGVLDETARDLVMTIAQMKERFESSEPATATATVAGCETVEEAEGKPVVVEAGGDAIAVHEEEIVGIDHGADAEIIGFVTDQTDRPRRRWFQIFRRA
jgi:vacuolar-type H+-ATPase subunit H